MDFGTLVCVGAYGVTGLESTQESTQHGTGKVTTRGRDGGLSRALLWYTDEGVKPPYRMDVTGTK